MKSMRKVTARTDQIIALVALLSFVLGQYPLLAEERTILGSAPAHVRDCRRTVYF